jgi:hypothetical protein
MSELARSLCEWAKTIDPKYHATYNEGKADVLAFVRMSVEERRTAVAKYSQQYCFPRFDLSRASGLYLLFRLGFELPQKYPRSLVKVFGGWLHPSTTEGAPTFNLSWPVQIEFDRAKVLRFQGYFGKGYDAVGEYAYFEELFPLRQEQVIRRLKISE